MSEEDDVNLRAAQRELLNALNELRNIEGHASLTSLPEPPFCSFCGRFKSEVGALVEGLEAHICLSCANEARSMLLRG
jgi:hypothetical protein